MRKVITIFLVIGNIYTFQHSSSQNTRDAFALCGTSYSEGHTQVGGDMPESAEFRKYQVDEGRVKGLLKEIKFQSAEFSFLASVEEHTRNHTSFYFLSNEQVAVNDLFLDSIFKPPKA